MVYYPKNGNKTTLAQFGAEPTEDWDIVAIDVLKNNIGKYCFAFLILTYKFFIN